MATVGIKCFTQREYMVQYRPPVNQQPTNPLPGSEPLWAFPPHVNISDYLVVQRSVLPCRIYSTSLSWTWNWTLRRLVRVRETAWWINMTYPGQNT